jgi:hypothetical protein
MVEKVADAGGDRGRRLDAPLSENVEPEDPLAKKDCEWV